MSTSPDDQKKIQAIKQRMDQERQRALEELNRLRDVHRENHTAEAWAAHRLRVSQLLLLLLFCTIPVSQCLNAVETEKGRRLTLSESIDEVKKLLAEGEPQIRAWFDDQLGTGMVQ